MSRGGGGRCQGGSPELQTICKTKGCDESGERRNKELIRNKQWKSRPFPSNLTFKHRGLLDPIKGAQRGGKGPRVRGPSFCGGEQAVSERTRGNASTNA